MAPPKKDAFLDLFNYANGSLLRSSPVSSLNDLSLKPAAPQQPKPSNTDNWMNLDILSPNQVLSPTGSKPLTPILANSSQNGAFLKSKTNVPAAVDPFDFFEQQTESSTQSLPTHSNTQTISDPFDIFNTQSSSPNVSKLNFSSESTLTHSQPRNDVALLEEEFTDAYTSTINEPVQEYHKQEIQQEVHVPVSSEIDERDHVLAELISEGIPINLANKAIDRAGPDYEKCMRLIVMNSARDQAPKLRSQKDLNGTIQDVSNDLYKKATWLFDKSRKTVIKNINNLQNQRTRREGGDMPAWIASQHKYKDQAVERRNDGTAYEDYGTDEDNIDSEEIRRIVQAQRQKEMERQRERLEALGRKSTKSRTGAEPNSLSRDERSRTGLFVEQPSISQSLPKPPVSRKYSEPTREARAGQLPQLSSPVQKQDPERPPVFSQPVPKEPEIDLLGLGSAAPLSRAQQFKQKNLDQSSYVSPSRRRNTPQAPLSASVPRPAISGPLNTFAQSDYDTNKAKGTEFFTSGDYDSALSAYTKCLESLPPKHEFRIVITANLALTAIKIGNYRLASQNCDEGLVLVGESFTDPAWHISDKHIKYWYVRLLTRKAESLEMLENFKDSLDCYMVLVKLGVNDKKTMDAKRRVNNIVNPPKPVQKKATPRPAISSSSSSSSSINNKNVQQVKDRHAQEKLQEQKKFHLHDAVHEKTQKWCHGKEDNLRSLLISLSDVLPQRLGFPFITTKKITINDLMLTKKVKINYMKVISSIHPDKLGGLELEDQMVCQAVFVTLNKAWDMFKQQNNIA